MDVCVCDMRGPSIIIRIIQRRAHSREAWRASERRENGDGMDGTGKQDGCLVEREWGGGGMGMGIRRFRSRVVRVLWYIVYM